MVAGEGLAASAELALVFRPDIVLPLVHTALANTKVWYFTTRESVRAGPACLKHDTESKQEPFSPTLCQPFSIQAAGTNDRKSVRSCCGGYAKSLSKHKSAQCPAQCNDLYAEADPSSSATNSFMFIHSPLRLIDSSAAKQMTVLSMPASGATGAGLS